MVYITFFARRDLWSLLIRWWTCKPGQPFADVPSHCGIAFITPSRKCLYFEAASPGVGVCYGPGIFALEADYSAPVQIPNRDGAVAFAVSCVGDRYDWSAVEADVICQALPKGLSIEDQQAASYDCSRFVQAVLKAGGMPLLQCQSAPPTPNDLMLALGGSK